MKRLLYIWGFACCLSCSEKGKYVAPKDPLFTKLEHSGIDFRNDVKDDAAFNAINYRNFYNGGGVAIGDINNDGLADVMMTANQGANRLYLNRGGMQFEDITEKSGLVKRHGWSTGVVFADVNADGWLDIYVCAAGIVQGDARKNELYINNGQLGFTEEAEKYHVQDSGGIHTHASFFDYDADGDLDLFLLNNSGLVPVSKFGRGSNRNMRNPLIGNKLLRNDGGFFTDASEEAGIHGSNIGFGLGVAVGDVNGDKWPDLYVSNDFFEKDYLYINDGKGRFDEISDSAISQMSQSSMGSDMADINNDGHADIFSTDMLPEDDYRLKKNTRFDNYDLYHGKYKSGFHHQYVSNMLHVNNGDGTFKELAQFAGVNATDWSWGALIFDCNNDGWKDIAVCNGMFLDVTDQDYIDFTASENNNKLFSKEESEKDYERVRSMLVSVPISNYLFVNNGNLQFTNEAYQLGLGEPSYSNGAAYGDLDNDGDLDLIINNVNSKAFVYKNNTIEKYKTGFLKVKLEGDSQNRFGIGAEATIFSGGQRQSLANFTSRGFQSSVDPVLHFGLGSIKSIDSVVVIWPDHKMQVLRDVKVNTVVAVSYKNADQRFSVNQQSKQTWWKEKGAASLTGNSAHKENQYVDFDRERLMPRMLSAEGPKLSVGDLNGDGLEDFFAGAAKHDTDKVFIQDKNGKFTRLLPQPAFVHDKGYETVGSAFVDIDRDGDLDLVAASGGNLDQEGSELLQLRAYLNNGKGFFTRNDKVLPDIRVNASCVVAGDFNKDGFPDLFIGGRSVVGVYGAPPESYLLQNNNGKYIDVTLELAPSLRHAGMVTDALWKDIDKDGIDELIITGEWMPVSIFKYTNNRFSEIENDGLKQSKGWWNCIETADLDNDGDLDLIAGNFGLNSKMKADRSRPARLSVNDFDQNGTTECVLSYYRNDGKSYPYYMRSDLVAQIPSLKKSFLRNRDYAGRTMNEVFTAKQLEGALVNEATEFRSCAFINDGNGNFSLLPLPDAAQLSPVYTILVDDINNDGHQDIFLAGNLYGLQPDFGRHDADNGTLLLGRGDLKFAYCSPQQSGLFYKGEARDAVFINLADKTKTILLARNNQPVLIYHSGRGTNRPD